MTGSAMGFLQGRTARKQLVASFSNRVARCRMTVRRSTGQIVPVQDGQYVVEKNSLAGFKRFDREAARRFLAEQFERDPEEIDRAVEGIYANRAVHGTLLSSTDVDREDVRRRDYERIQAKIRMGYAEYCACEDEVIREMLPPIKTTYRCHVAVSYVSPGGRNSYQESYLFDLSEVERILAETRQKSVEQDVGKLFRKRQRGAMTKKLRYSVLKRDGFRCVLCGRGIADGARCLEVDHIQPVSKGGRTELPNLRTLCFDCNRGKRDEWDPDGSERGEGDA